MAKPKRTFGQRVAGFYDAIESRFAPGRFRARRLAHLEITQTETLLRLQAHMVARDSAGTETTKGKNWLTSRLSPDTELETEQEETRNRSRDLYLKDPIAASHIKGRVTNVVGTGMTPQSQIRGDELISQERAEALNSQLEELARRQMKRSDISGVIALWMQQRLIQRCVDRDGEAFVVFSDKVVARKPLPLAAEVVSVQRIETPAQFAGDANVRLGRRRDKDGTVISYFIRKTEPNDQMGWDESYDEVPVDRVCHIYEQDEPGASRGWPANVASQRTLKNAWDYEEAVLIAKQVQACYTAFVPKPRPTVAAINAATSTDTDGRRNQQISPGGIVYYDPITEGVPTFADPGKGGEDHATYMDSLARKAAAGMNYPAEMLAKNYGAMNFASTRASIIEGRIEFDAAQLFHVDLWLSRWWEEFVREAVIAGEVDITPAEYNERPHVFERHIWVPCQRDWVDPLKDVNANVAAVNAGVRSKSMVAATAGTNFDDVIDQQVRERIREANADLIVQKRKLEIELELLKYRKQIGLPDQVVPPSTPPNQPPPPDDAEDDEDEEDEADEENDEKQGDSA
jgi:lambda family phage portal protein